LANKTSLEYGEFVKWLKTVLKHQQTLMASCSDEKIDNVLNKLLKSGTTTIGEISSFGLDIKSCKASKINVVLFNEVLGSSPDGVDMMYQNFLQRYQTTLSLKDDRFIPAISIHAPYSTHPILAKKVLLLAKEDDTLVATHFMESKAEREWLDSGKGEFKEFLKSFNPYAKPLVSSMEFLKLFYGIDTLFIHATFANDEELEYINSHDYFITSCPVSNRVLENAKLDISKVKNLTIATDGLTSNISLNLWDELRHTLFIHENIDIDKLSKKLLNSVTRNAGVALKLNKGVLKEGYDADMIVVKLPDSFEELESIYKWLILHIKEAHLTIIQGEEI
jgi:cytosine/adenosine deaminase-related metal-dependent hydrolase